MNGTHEILHPHAPKRSLTPLPIKHKGGACNPALQTKTREHGKPAVFFIFFYLPTLHFGLSGLNSNLIFVEVTKQKGHVMNPHLALWAKLGNHPYPECYHPLLFHLIDVAQVCRQLWQSVLRDSLKKRLANSFGLSVDDCGCWFSFWAGAHDIGKASPCFQCKGNSDGLVELLKSQGYDFNQTGDVPHATISVPVLNEHLKAWGLNSTLARRIAVAVGGHHGVFPSAQKWASLRGTASLGKEKWFTARQEILEALASLLALPRDRPPASGDNPDQSNVMLLAGLTSVADWIGSNKAFFAEKGNPKTSELDRHEAERLVTDYFAQAEGQARKALRVLGWLKGAESAPEKRSFLELFPQFDPPRPLQKRAESVTQEIDGPALYLIESPMGEGKTEAALYVADVCERTGGQGFYVALPTMATSNGMFGRVKEYLEKNHPGRLQLHLLHGHALLSPAYEKLKDEAKANPFDAIIYDDDNHPGAVVADAWFAQDKKQGLLAPFAVGTIDQSLLAILQTKHFFVRLFGLAGKTVILDEVHAYDVYMTTLMKRLLEWLSALGCPVVLLSATLPKAKRLELIQAYAGPEVEITEDKNYPRMTIAHPGATTIVHHIPASSAKTVHLEWRDSELSTLVDELAKGLQNGGCAAVIRNTVGLAQETYLALKEPLSYHGIEVELFHARFPFGRRQEIEENVLRRYGKEGPRPAKAVLVATQVVEQSLDLDFDLLVTDVAPVDLVLQRAGRLWRHDRGPRPCPWTAATVWLLQPEFAEDSVPDFGVSEWVYERFILLRSYLVLGKSTSITLPNDVEKLIESVYGEGWFPQPNRREWQEALSEAERHLKAEQKEYRKEAKTFLVHQPIGEDDIFADFNQQLDEDNPDAPKSQQACTRLAEPSIPLVVLYDCNGTPCLDPAGKEIIDLKHPPSFDQARSILGNALTVQHKGCVFHYVGKEPPNSWKKSGLLRYHRIVLLDNDGTALKDEYPLFVDPKLGVVFQKQDGSTG